MSPQLIAALGLGAIGAISGGVGQGKKNKFHEEYARALEDYANNLRGKGIEDQNMLISAFRQRAAEGGVRAGMQGKQAQTDLGGQSNEALSGGSLSNVARGAARASQGMAMEEAGNRGAEVLGNMTSAIRASEDQKSYQRRLEALKRDAEQAAKTQRDKKKDWWKSAAEGAANAASTAFGLF